MFELRLKVVDNKERPPIPRNMPYGYANLMKKCWKSEPLKRPTFNEVIANLEQVTKMYKGGPNPITG